MMHTENILLRPPISLQLKNGVLHLADAVDIIKQNAYCQTLFTRVNVFEDNKVSVGQFGQFAVLLRNVIVIQVLYPLRCVTCKSISSR